MKEIDLDGQSLSRAKTTIIDSIGNHYHLDEIGLKFIHGYNRGTAIQTYLRSAQLNSDLTNDGFNAKLRIDQSKPGSTTVYFN